jgi:DtxR family Mn-dependent transcriptional regulator
LTSCCEISHTEAVEDCLRTIFKLAGRNLPVTTSALAESLGVAPPTVSAMLKRLEAGELVTRAAAPEIRLTAHGERHARGVTRRHRLVETFLVQVLGLSWDEVHAEADVLEHAISDRLEDRIDSVLGHPTHDPHGDPIPTADLQLAEQPTQRLSDLEPGARGTFVRISDADPEMLRYLAEREIAPGACFEVEDKQPFGGPLFARFGDETQIIGGRLADAMRVQEASP